MKWRGQALRDDGPRDELPFIRLQIATGGNYLQSGGGARSAPAATHERSLFVLGACRNEAGRKVPIDVSARGQGARVSRCLRGVKSSYLTIYLCDIASWERSIQIGTVDGRPLQCTGGEAQMPRFRVLGTNPMNFTVSSLDRTFAFFPNMLGFARTRCRGWRRPVIWVLLSVTQADSP